MWLHTMGVARLFQVGACFPHQSLIGVHTWYCRSANTSWLKNNTFWLWNNPWLRNNTFWLQNNMFWLWNNLLTYPYPNTYFVLSCPTARVRAKPFLRLETFSPEKQQDDEDAQILSYCFLMFFVSSQPINIGPWFNIPASFRHLPPASGGNHAFAPDLLPEGFWRLSRQLECWILMTCAAFNKRVFFARSACCGPMWTVDPSGSMSTHQVVNRRTLTRSAVKKFSTSAAYGCLSCLVWILVVLAVQPPRSCKSLPAVACCSKIPRQVRTVTSSGSQTVHWLDTDVFLKGVRMCKRNHAWTYTWSMEWTYTYI